MRSVGLALFLSVNLGGGFGNASAEIVSYSDEGMNVRIQVEVEVGAESVVAHLQAPGQPQLTIPMLSKGGGVYEIQTDLPPVDFQVVFETVGSPGALSAAVSLSALGVEFPDDPASTVPDDGGAPAPEVSQWGWLALALAAASLSALAFWVLGGSDEDDESIDDKAAAGEAG